MYRIVGDFIVEIENGQVSERSKFKAVELMGRARLSIVSRAISTVITLWMISLLKPLFNFDLSFLEDPSMLSVYILSVTAGIIVFDYIYSKVTNNYLLSKRWGNNVALIVVYSLFFSSDGAPDFLFYLSSVIISIQGLLDNLIHSSTIVNEINYLNILLSMKQTDEVLLEIETLFPRVELFEKDYTSDEKE